MKILYESVTCMFRFYRGFGDFLFSINFYCKFIVVFFSQYVDVISKNVYQNDVFKLLFSETVVKIKTLHLHLIHTKYKNLTTFLSASISVPCSWNKPTHPWVCSNPVKLPNGAQWQIVIWEKFNHLQAILKMIQIKRSELCQAACKSVF